MNQIKTPLYSRVHIGDDKDLIFAVKGYLKVEKSDLYFCHDEEADFILCEGGQTRVVRRREVVVVDQTPLSPQSLLDYERSYFRRVGRKFEVLDSSNKVPRRDLARRGVR